MHLIVLCFGVLSGITTVLFGFGGGFIVVPVFYAILMAQQGANDLAAMHVAVATSTCVMIFGSSMATLRHHRAGQLQWPLLRSWMGSITVGAVLGAVAATAVKGAWVHGAFVAYLGMSIASNILQPGFTRLAATHIRLPGKTTNTIFGVAIGCVAAALGVGGSVMTVPLLRRRGASMATATAMASPLSLPMAVVGTATYILLAWNTPTSSAWQFGYVDVRAGLILVAGSWLGIWMASPWIHRISDQLHARAYTFLLCLSLVVMLMM